MACRCGHEGEGEHPCHGEDYTCRKPAKRYFYDGTSLRFALAGMQMKLSVSDTWACDGCWAWFSNLLKERDAVRK